MIERQNLIKYYDQKVRAQVILDQSYPICHPVDSSVRLFFSGNPSLETQIQADLANRTQLHLAIQNGEVEIVRPLMAVISGTTGRIFPIEQQLNNILKAEIQLAKHEASQGNHLASAEFYTNSELLKNVRTDLITARKRHSSSH